MAEGWVQIGEEDLEGKYDEIALIGIAHERFAERFAISFTENANYGAGPAAFAIIELRSGTQFIVQHEYGHPEPGVWLVGRVDADADKQRAEFADVLGLETSDYRLIKRGDRWFDAGTGGPI
jgi:hypothetical protein